MKRTIISLVCAVLLGSLLSSSALAQEGGGRKRAKLVLDQGILVGKIRKPQVQFLISRQKSINQEAIELKESFVPRVIEAVKESPF